MSDAEYWTSESVAEAIAHAAQVWRHIPAERGPAGLKAFWPETSREAPTDFKEKRAFEDARILRDAGGFKIKAADGETYATEFAPGFDRTSPPSPQEVSAAERVQGWLGFLGGRQDVVDAVWVCAGGGFHPSDASKIIGKHRGMAHPPGRDRVRMARDAGLALIARGLNRSLRMPRIGPDFEASELELDPARMEAMRNACIAALEALDPFVAALGIGAPTNSKMVPVSVRHLYKAAKATAQLMTALQKKPTVQS